MNRENKINFKDNFNINGDKINTNELRKILSLIIENNNKIIELQITKIMLLKKK